MKNAIPTPGRQTMFDRLHAGDNQAWELFAETYQTLIGAMGLKAGLYECEIGDLISRVMLKFFNRKKVFEYAPEKNGLFRNYLWRVIHNCIHDIQRERSADLLLQDSAASEEAELVPADDDFNENLRMLAMQEALEEIKKELPSRAVTAFISCKLRGQSPRDAAKLLQVSLATVYNDCNMVWRELSIKTRAIAKRNGYC